MRRTNRWIALILFLAILLSTGVVSVSAARLTPLYVAFGDSISRGYGLADIPTQAFPNLLADRIGYTLSNYAVDGYTAEDIYNLISDGKFDEEIKEAQLITITCGGNDLMATLYDHIAVEYNALNEPDITPKEVLVALDGRHPSITQAEILLYATGILNNFTAEDAFKKGLSDYTQNLTKLMQYLRSINPDVKIIIPTQYSPYEVFRNSFIFRLLYTEVEAGVVELNKVIRAQASVLGYTVSDVYSAFKAKAPTNLCNANAYDYLAPNLDFHPNARGHAAIAETVYTTFAHQHSYRNVWDNTHHYQICECGHATEKQLHSGGNATCYERAVCEICQASYGSLDVNNHTGETEIRNAKSFDEFEDGYTGDIYCSSCNTLLSLGQIIPKTHKHEYQTPESLDGTHHVLICFCGERQEQAHSGGQANCKDRALCEVCQTPYGELNIELHIGETELRHAKDTAEFEDGYTGDTHCAGCGELLMKGERIPATHQHNFATPKQLNDTHHALVCACGESQEQAHSGGAANCRDKALCEVCQTPYGELNAELHIGETEVRNAKQATEFEEGYTGDTHCAGCGTVLENGQTIPSTHEHTFDQCEKLNDTMHALRCACGLQQEEPHTFDEQKICTLCGFVVESEQSEPEPTPSHPVPEEPESSEPEPTPSHPVPEEPESSFSVTWIIWGGVAAIAVIIGFVILQKKKKH